MGSRIVNSGRWWKVGAALIGLVFLSSIGFWGSGEMMAPVEADMGSSSSWAASGWESGNDEADSDAEGLLESESDNDEEEGMAPIESDDDEEEGISLAAMKAMKTM